MSEKPTIQQENAAKLDELLKQKVSTGDKGFLNKNLKRFVAEELIHAANNNKKSIPKSETLQKRYNRFKKYYDKLFTTGMNGHGIFAGQIENNYKKDTEKGTKYYIRENGKDKEVSYAELGYKLELLSHNLSVKHDVAFTKFKPIYYLTGKGKYKIVFNIPKVSEIDFKNNTVEEIMEELEDENIEVIISDPSKVINREERSRKESIKKKRQKTIRTNKEKFYKQWKKEKAKTKKPAKKQPRRKK